MMLATPTTKLHTMLQSLVHDTGYPYHQTTHNATECLVHDTGYPHHQITKLQSLWCIMTCYHHHAMLQSLWCMMTLVIPTTKLHTMLQSVVQINTGYPTTKLHTMLQSCHQPTKSYRVCNTDSNTQWYQLSHHYTTNKTTATYACISLFSSFWRRRRKGGKKHTQKLHYLT